MLRLGNLPRYLNASVHSGEDVILTATGPGSERVRGSDGQHRGVPRHGRGAGIGRADHHNCLDASRAPSLSEASFIQTILVSTCTRPANVPKPQSMPAMTFSRPTALGVLHDALGDQFRMLDEVRSRIDHARDDRLAVRQLDVLPDLPLVAVTRIGAGNDTASGFAFSTMSTMSFSGTSP